MASAVDEDLLLPLLPVLKEPETNGEIGNWTGRVSTRTLATRRACCLERALGAHPQLACCWRRSRGGCREDRRVGVVAGHVRRRGVARPQGGADVVADLDLPVGRDLRDVDLVEVRLELSGGEAGGRSRGGVQSGNPVPVGQLCESWKSSVAARPRRGSGAPRSGARSATRALAVDERDGREADDQHRGHDHHRGDHRPAALVLTVAAIMTRAGFAEHGVLDACDVMAFEVTCRPPMSRTTTVIEWDVPAWPRERVGRLLGEVRR